MDTAKLFDPILDQLRKLEAQVERLRREADTRRATWSSEAQRRLDAALGEARHRTRQLTDAWRAQGDGLRERNRKAADETRARLESAIGALRTRSRGWLEWLGGARPAGQTPDVGGPQG